MDRAPAQHLTVSIVSYKSPPEILADTLRSLAQALHTAYAGGVIAGCRVYLIDNNDDAGEQLALSSFSTINLAASNGEFSLIQGHGNVGFGAGHNLAIGVLESDVHLLLNPDVELDAHCLLEGMKYINANPDVAIVSPQAFDAQGDRQYLCKRYPSVLLFFIRGFLPALLRKPFHTALACYEMHELPDNQPSHHIPIVSGCFMLCSTAKLQQVAGFDENYFLYFEDFDLSLRLGKIGELVYQPGMVITHHGGDSAKKGWTHIRMFVRSGFRFFNTYGWRLL